jgi:hypothetical protein
VVVDDGLVHQHDEPHDQGHHEPLAATEFEHSVILPSAARRIGVS